MINDYYDYDVDDDDDADDDDSVPVGRRPTLEGLRAREESWRTGGFPKFGRRTKLLLSRRREMTGADALVRTSSARPRWFRICESHP